MESVNNEDKTHSAPSLEMATVWSQPNPPPPAAATNLIPSPALFTRVGVLSESVAPFPCKQNPQASQHKEKSAIFS
jgi:hypothetical protein